MVEFLKSLDWALFLYVYMGYISGIITEKIMSKQPKAIEDAKRDYVKGLKGQIKSLEGQIKCYEEMESNWENSLSIHKDIITLKDEIIEEHKSLNKKQDILMKDKSKQISNLIEKLKKEKRKSGKTTEKDKGPKK